MIEKLTSSKTGSVKSKVLPLGKYTLTEISAPDGYVLDSTPHPFTLAAVDQQTAIVEIKVSASNTYLPVRVSWRKQKEDLLLTQTQEGMIRQTVEVYSGEGFVFGLYTGEIITYGDSQKLPANTLVATGTTDAQGNLTLSGLYPHGNYYIRELSVPDGWLLSTEKYPVTLTPANKAVSENVITVYLENPILNRLICTPVTITKTDITGAKKLPGALIEVYDADGNTIAIDFRVAALSKTPRHVLQRTGTLFRYYSTAILGGFWQLATGQVGVEELSGPIGTATTIGQAMQYGWQDVFSLLALITINIGIFNLLPIPALDGCKLIFLLIEAIFGRAAPQKLQMVVNTAGMALLLWLMVLVTMQDLTRFL